MKHLKFVSATNLKGRSFQHTLAPFTLVTGPNATGKTALTDAVTIGLTGILPKLGKRNADTFRLASGQRMTVGLSFSDGATVDRSWTESKGSVKAEASVDTALAPYLLDANEYFQLSDRERMKLVFSIAPGLQDAVTVERVVADIKRIKLDDHTEHAEKVLTECAKIVADEKQSRSTQDWLDAAVAALKVKQTEANAALKRMSGTASGMAELGRESVLFSERDLKQARDRHASALRSHEAATQNHRKALADSGRKLELEANVGKLESAIGDRSALQSNLTALRSKAAEYRSQTAALAEALKTAERAAEQHREAVRNLEGWENRVATIRQQCDTVCDYAAAVRAIEGQVEDLQREVDAYVSATGRLQADRSSFAADSRAQLEIETTANQDAAKLVSKRDTLLAKTCCPTCGENGDHWRGRIADDYDEQIRKQQAISDTASAKRKEDFAKMDALDVAIANSVNADAAEKKNRQKLVELRGQLDRAKTDDANYRAAVERLKDLQASKPTVPPFTDMTDDARSALAKSKVADSAHAEELRQIAAVEQQLADLQKRAEQVAAAKGELAALVHEDADTMAGFVGSAKQSLDEAASKVEQLQRAQRESDAAKAEQLARLKAVEALQNAVTELAATKRAVVTVEDIQRELVATAFNGLLAVANRIAGQVLRSPLEYRDGDIGRFDGKHWITQRTFSGTEQAVTYSAFAVALAAASELKLCIVDEIGRLDRASRKKLFSAVRSALADGVIGQFIGVMPELDDSTPEGATVIVTK